MRVGVRPAAHPHGTDGIPNTSQLLSVITREGAVMSRTRLGVLALLIAAPLLIGASLLVFGGDDPVSDDGPPPPPAAPARPEP